MILNILTLFLSIIQPIFGPFPVLQVEQSFGWPLKKHLFGHPDFQQKKLRSPFRCAIGQAVVVRRSINKLSL